MTPSRPLLYFPSRGRNVPGIQEIAKIAGVSPATVSRALRGLHHVNAETRARIIAAAKELNYPIETSAHKTFPTNTVGVIAPFTSRWYFSQAIAGVEQALREAGMDLLLYNYNRHNGREKIFQSLNLRERVDALIIISLPPTEEENRTLLSLGIPVSLIGYRTPGVTSVSIDDVEGARIATQHLVNQGHKNIGLISGAPTGSVDYPAPKNRRIGFMEVLNDAGLTFNPQHEVHADFTIATGESAMEELLSRPNPPTAVFCESDEMAYGAILAMRKRGLKYPDDISLIGYDGHDLAEFANLTTVAQPVHMLGELAAWSVMEKLNKPDTPIKTLTLPTTLILRGSTKKIN